MCWGSSTEKGAVLAARAVIGATNPSEADNGTIRDKQNMTDKALSFDPLCKNPF